MIFYSSSRASLAVLVVSVIAISAAPSLTVKTSVPNVNIDGLGNLKVTATITNTCNETLKLLNDPRGVLNPFPENSFSITGAAGSRPLFDGAKANYGPVCKTDTYAHSLVSASRSSSAPRTLPASMIPAFSPFSILALPSVSSMIVSGYHADCF